MRIPVEFGLHCEHFRCNVATGDTATFWFGMLLVAGSLWGLWIYRRQFGVRMAAYLGLLFVGAYMVVCGALGIVPFKWLS